MSPFCRTRAVLLGSALLLALGVAGPAPAGADVLEVVTTGEVEFTRLGITETYRATAIAPDGTRRPLPDLRIGGSGEVASVDVSPDGALLAVGFYGGHQGATVVRSDGTGRAVPTLFPVESGSQRTWTTGGRRLLFDPLRDTTPQIDDSEFAPLRGRLGVCDVATGRCHLRRVAGAAAGTLPDGSLVSATTAAEARTTEADLRWQGSWSLRGSATARRRQAAASRARTVRVEIAGPRSSGTAWARSASLIRGVATATGAVAGPDGVLLTRTETRVGRPRTVRCGTVRTGTIGTFFPPTDDRRRCVVRRPSGPVDPGPLLVRPDRTVAELAPLRLGRMPVAPVLGLPGGGWLGISGAENPPGSLPAVAEDLMMIAADGQVSPVTVGGGRATVARLAAAVGRRPAVADETVDLLGYERATDSAVVRFAVTGGADEPGGDLRAVVRVPLRTGVAPGLVAVEDEGGGEDAPAGEIVGAW